MVENSEGDTSVISVTVSPSLAKKFVDWQGKLNSSIAASPGFLSLEILSPSKKEASVWTLIQRFSSKENSALWTHSKEYTSLIDELTLLVGPDLIQQLSLPVSALEKWVTEVFVTQVTAGKEEAFREWIAKMHRAEARFTGFRGMYVQSPNQEQGANWLTFLHFDTSENLEKWLASAERKEILEESATLIKTFESHRVISPYAGWFSSLEHEGALPAAWKQTMVVLLVLFPIVMVELKYLSPLTASFNSAVATFIGNAISVTLIAWPMMPFAIRYLNWWLLPKEGAKKKINRKGLLVVLLLYLLEIAFFWNLLK